MLRVQENCLELKSFSSRILNESKISLLAVEGNLFDMKAFHDVDGYDQVIVNYFFSTLLYQELPIETFGTFWYLKRMDTQIDKPLQFQYYRFPSIYILVHGEIHSN